MTMGNLLSDILDKLYREENIAASNFSDYYHFAINRA